MAKKATRAERQLRAWKAACYTRLSVDDGEAGQSGSVISQRKIIEAWANAQDDVEIVEQFVDDGWSGSNFDRPGFKAMMEAVEAGRINCILVKDLSRLGRNYLETGRYLEQVFPEKGVRLVAVNDGYDGLDVLGAMAGDPGIGAADAALLVPFKNLINDYYCATTSAKIKSALAVRRADGMYVGGMAPYGYVKDPNDHHVLIVDPEAAPVVQRIFTLRAAGESFARIAHVLNDEGVVPPSELRRQRAGENDGKTEGWHASYVSKILKDRTYTGTLVQGRTFKPSFRQPRRLDRPPELWSVVPGACPAIVDQELFGRVQQLGEEVLSTGGRRCDNPLRGIVFCGACGERMKVNSVSNGRRRYVYYRCTGGCRPSPQMADVLAEVESIVGSTDRAYLLERGVRVKASSDGSVVVEYRGE